MRRAGQPRRCRRWRTWRACGWTAAWLFSFGGNKSRPRGEKAMLNNEKTTKTNENWMVSYGFRGMDNFLTVDLRSSSSCDAC